jgi:hypothetical protein
MLVNSTLGIVTNPQEPINARAKAIRELLNKFTLCEDIIFDCQDASLRPGRFEEVCPLDIKPNTDKSSQRARIDSLLRVRAKLNLRIKIAKRMRQKLSNKLSQ